MKFVRLLDIGKIKLIFKVNDCRVLLYNNATNYWTNSK